MTNSSHSRHTGLRGIMRDVFVLVLAEALIVIVAWFLSTHGKAWLAHLFGGPDRNRGHTTTNSTAIDI